MVLGWEFQNWPLCINRWALGEKKPLEIGNWGYWLNKQIDTRAGLKKKSKPNYTLTQARLKKQFHNNPTTWVIKKIRKN